MPLFLAEDEPASGFALIAPIAEAALAAFNYRTVRVSECSLAAHVESCFDAGGRIVLVGARLGRSALSISRVVTEQAQRAEVVDVLIRQFDGSVFGDNSAGTALVDDLCRRRGHALRDRRTLLLGMNAGVLPALIDAGVGDVAVASVGEVLPLAMLAQVGAPGQVNLVDWQDLGELGAFDLVLHDSDAALDPRWDLPLRLLAPQAVACECGRGRLASTFIAWARAGGCVDVSDGLGYWINRVAAISRFDGRIELDADELLSKMT